MVLAQGIIAPGRKYIGAREPRIGHRVLQMRRKGAQEERVPEAAREEGGRQEAPKEPKEEGSVREEEQEELR